MKRLFWLLLASLAALILVKRFQNLRVRDLAQQANEPGRSHVKGHRWFAAAYDVINQWGEATVLGRFRPWIAGQATGRALEIGVGTGAKFPYYRAVEKIVAIEPDPFMLERARKRAAKLGLDVEFHQGPAEALPFADASFDTVVATLVFCTIGDPSRALAEVRRVLKPEGTFRFIEHVRAEGGLLARVQDALTPLWSRVGAGCHLNRRTVEAIREAGFEIVAMQRRPFGPTPLMIGVARPKQQKEGEQDDFSG